MARRDDDSYKGSIDDIKLKDGLMRHRRKKALLYEYSKNTGKSFILPLVLITTKDIEHSKEVKKEIESKEFFKGEYKAPPLSHCCNKHIPFYMNLQHIDKKNHFFISAY